MISKHFHELGTVIPRIEFKSPLPVLDKKPDEGEKLKSHTGGYVSLWERDPVIWDRLHLDKTYTPSEYWKRLKEWLDKNIDKLELVIPQNLRKLKTYNSMYTFILNNKGGIVDDLIISKVNIDDCDYFFLVYNAARKKIDQEIISNLVSDVDILLDSTILAIQGPLSQNIINNLFPESKDMKFMQIITINYKNENILISRSGYTGEDGFEIFIPNKVITEFINKILSYEETLLCGLGSRDSLRLEAGLCLYGNELNENISPIQANLGWAIPKSRIKQGGFKGHKRILNEINNGVNKKRVGIKLKSKSILRSHMTLHDNKEFKIGEITSGGFSPSLNISIAMAYIDTNIISEPIAINCLIRNNMEEVEITNLPFIQHNYKRGKQ